MHCVRVDGFDELSKRELKRSDCTGDDSKGTLIR